jgi:uncharacterized protein YcfL
MARITVNTSDTQPVLIISTNVDPATYVITWDATKDIYLPCVQDITINSATGVFSYSAFVCQSNDMRKITTPADNSIALNVVLDDTTWFSTTYGTAGPVPVAGSAVSAGVQYIQQNDILIGFRIYWNDADGIGAGKKYREGVGYIVNAAPTVSPDAPVWVSPLEIAVDGTYIDGANP